MKVAAYKFKVSVMRGPARQSFFGHTTTKILRHIFPWLDSYIPRDTIQCIEAVHPYNDKSPAVVYIGHTYYRHCYICITWLLSQDWQATAGDQEVVTLCMLQIFSLPFGVFSNSRLLLQRNSVQILMQPLFCKVAHRMAKLVEAHSCSLTKVLETRRTSRKKQVKAGYIQ